jgi:hypothetical protein
MKTHVIMFSVRFETETARVATLAEIEALEVIINRALQRDGKVIATAKLARNETADWTAYGLINQHLVQIDENKNK